MSDEKAIEAIICRDESAISKLMTKYTRLIWSVVYAVLKNTAAMQDIEECVADVFIYMWDHPEKYDPSRGSLKTWLTIVARSHAIDRYRRILRNIELPLDEKVLAESVDISDEIASEELRGQMRAALDSLSEQDRDIFVRRYFCDQKPKQIARALNIPVKRVENRLYQTKLKLRELMTD